MQQQNKEGKISHSWQPGRLAHSLGTNQQIPNDRCQIAWCSESLDQVASIYGRAGLL